MGYPDLQDGRPPRHRAGAGLPDGPEPAEMPGEEAAGYHSPPAPAMQRGQRPGPRTGAHRAMPGDAREDRSWPGGPGPAGQAPPRSPSATSPTGTDDRYALPQPRHTDGGRAWPPGPAPRPQPPARAPRDRTEDEPPGLAITRERPGARRNAARPGGSPSGGGRRGPVRGYPPRPGQPDPVYPPGQFSAWNRASARAAWLGAAGAGDGAAEAEAEPGYSALALSDASADLTSTQTWAVIDGEPPLSPPATPGTRRDWASHADDTGPGWQRTATRGRDPGRAAGYRDTGSRATGSAGALPGTERGPTRPGGPDIGAGVPGRAGDRAQPGSRMAARRAAERQAPTAFGDPEPGRRDRATATSRMAATSPGTADGTASAGRTASVGRSRGRGGRRNLMMAALLLAPVLVVVLVVGGYVYLSGRHAPTAPPRPPASSHRAAPDSPAAAASLGPWKHIESRSQDPVPLTVAELFPARFTQGGQAGTLTVSKSGSKCSREVIGSKLAAAVRKADCTQVLRASYLSTDNKIMATVGVLNLENVAAAEKAGKAAGATEFIKQLPSAHGPTRKIAQGTGIVQAEFKGHYLILTWTEFTDLHAPSGKKQRQKLEAFSAGLVAGTANVSLTTRMVTGQPPGATSKS